MKFLLIFFMVIVITSAVDYCRLHSCYGKSHTACLFPQPGHSRHCTGYQGSGLTDDEKQKIVQLHNYYRHLVASGQEKRGSPGPQSPAKYMPNLEWDDEIADIAQRWADQCTWGHDSCRNIERFPVGQNIAFLGTTANIRNIKVESMVKMWYEEVKYFSRYQISKFSNLGSGGRMIGHYTQMIWAKTTKIGCGAVKYNDGRFNRFYLVCNYGPAGNYLTQPVYEIR